MTLNDPAPSAEGGSSSTSDTSEYQTQSRILRSGEARFPLLSNDNFATVFANRGLDIQKFLDDGKPLFENPIFKIRKFSFGYNTATKVLHDLTLDLGRGIVTALIGASGCGKSTLLKALNRLHDETVHPAGLGKYPLFSRFSPKQLSAFYSGEVSFEELNVLSPKLAVYQLRERVGYIAQEPWPFEKSIFNNVAYGLQINRNIPKQEHEERVIEALKSAHIWEEVKDKLKASGYALSGGQQQRLCIARAIAVKPQVLLMDEPCSKLDPISTRKIEDLIDELTKVHNMTIVIVTHTMAQAARVSDFTIFMEKGRVVEYSATPKLFLNPENPKTEQYLCGHYG